MDTPTEAAPSPLAVIRNLADAINRHDLDAMAACFDSDYQSEFPAHPDRAFRGHAPMRQNWTQIFGAVPDLEARLLASAEAGGTVWAEWDWKGTRRDGAPHRMRGVTVQGVTEGRIAWVRLYMEPVQEGGGTAAAIRASVGPSEGPGKPLSPG